jgi:protein gp37
MSDLFHEDVPIPFILRMFAIMEKASWHRFQILTKRAKRLFLLDSNISWPENVWMGVSVENDKYKYRIDYLRNTGAKTKFVSIEPLIGPVGKINLNEINWIIVGGESGPKARPMEKDWVIDIRNQCTEAGVPFFFKQWGGFNKKKNGRLLDGRTWDQMPIAGAVNY